MRALLLALILLALHPAVYAQARPAPTARDRANEDGGEAGRVQAIIDQAEGHFKLGELSARGGKPDAARAEFDRAVDAVLESGLDVRANPRLQAYYLQLVERIYRLEAPAPPARPAGALPQLIPPRPQKFEPSPLDELAQLSPSSVGQAQPAPAACQPSELSGATLRGFRLGMTVNEVRRALPPLSVSRPDRRGRSTGGAIISGVRRAAPTEALKGVKAVAFTFLDGRVVYIGISYDDSIRWDSLDEFVRRTSEALRLPARWLPDGGGSRHTLTCGSYSISAEFLYPYARSVPVIRLTDLGAETTYRKRVEEAAQRRRLEEEKKRRAFKP